MSELKALTGPWMVSMKRFGGVTSYIICNHVETAISCDKESYWANWYEPCTDQYVYYQPYNNMDCEQHRIATARLIAAAPDLYWALMMVLDDPQSFDGRPRTYEVVMKALAKARGEL